MNQPLIPTLPSASLDHLEAVAEARGWDEVKRDIRDERASRTVDRV